MDARSPHSEMGNVEWAMLLGLSVLWGGSYFFYAVLTAALPPLTVVLGRVGIAAIFLHLALAVTRRPMPWRAPWGAFAVMGMLNNVIPFTLVAFGVTQISSSLAAILNATTPLFTVLTAHILTNETLTPAKALGVLCGVLGVVVLIGPAALADLGSGDVLGQICCLLAALSYAFAGIYGRRFRALPSLDVATGQLTASALLILPAALLVDRIWLLPPPGTVVWATFAGIALLSTALAYILYFAILARAGPTNLLLVTLVSPVGAMLLGGLILGEVIAPRAYAGMALISLGLAVIDGRLLARLRPVAAPRNACSVPSVMASIPYADGGWSQGCMQSLAGTTWRVIEAQASDATGGRLLPLGPHPLGIVMFDTERMVGAIVDGSACLPPGAPPRFFVAYTGRYRFDGSELVTRVDDASRPELRVDQVRRLRFESETRMVAIPVSGMPEQNGIEVVWERIGLC